MKTLQKIKIAGKTVLPIVEGGKGIMVSNGTTAGHFARAGAVGTLSGTAADRVPRHERIFHAKTVRQRQDEVQEQNTAGVVAQTNLACEISNGNGVVMMNVLWELGRIVPILEGVLPLVRGKLDAVACGAGMPFQLAELCAKNGIYFVPIISSARAFKILWARGFKPHKEWLGAVIYEDPWLAGGHLGITNSDPIDKPVKPMDKLIELRSLMRELGIGEDVPIIMAGGVWNLAEWQDFIDNPAIGAIAFQFGTRPILVQESHVAKKWQPILMNLTKDDIAVNKFSPTGFYSMAVRNSFFKRLEARKATEDWDGPRGENTVGMSTPDGKKVWLTRAEADDIKKMRGECVGCIAHCSFSGFCDFGDTTMPLDPRSFCISRQLYWACYNENPDEHLMFVGANGHRFATDPMYENDHIPTIKELVQAIMEGR
ncbi:MAG: nitronate monooxygenase [Alphaproteobacteria bacterium]|nr:nitronate monooxygenase [Alphaproteobacteria bacterium]